MRGGLSSPVVSWPLSVVPAMELTQSRGQAKPPGHPFCKVLRLSGVLQMQRQGQGRGAPEESGDWGLWKESTVGQWARGFLNCFSEGWEP